MVIPSGKVKSMLQLLKKQGRGERLGCHCLKHLSPDPVDVSEGNCGYSKELFTISG